MKFKILKNEFLKNISYILKLENNLAKQTVQQVESTNACMMDCIICPRRNMKRKIGFMGMPLFKKIINQLEYNDELWLHHFGDPLIHPHITEMINYVSKKEIKPKISVNPNLLTFELSEKLLNSGLHTLMISLDGIDDKTYKYIRGENANYEQALENINTLLKLKNKKKSNMRIVMSMIKLKLNKYQDEEFKKMWKKNGVNEVSIKKFITWDGSDKTINELGNKSAKRRGAFCSESWFKTTITWDGKVVPCCYDYDAKFILGDLNKETLNQIWNNKRIKLLRRAIKQDKLKLIPLCKNCKDQINTSIIKYNPFKIRLKHLSYLLNKLRECIKPELGHHIFELAFKKPQLTLFEGEKNEMEKEEIFQ